MSSRVAAKLVWPLWALTIAFAVAAPLISTEETGSLIIVVPLGVWAVTSATVGTIIASRRRGNPIGWILCAIGFLWASNTFFGLYTIRALVTHPGSLPAGGAAAWISTWINYPAFGLLAYLFLLFPDGRPLSPRWRTGSRCGPGSAGPRLSRRPSPRPGVTVRYR